MHFIGVRLFNYNKMSTIEDYQQWCKCGLLSSSLCMCAAYDYWSVYSVSMRRMSWSASVIVLCMAASVLLEGPGLMEGFRVWAQPDYRKAASVLVGDPQIHQFRGGVQQVDGQEQELMDDGIRCVCTFNFVRLKAIPGVECRPPFYSAALTHEYNFHNLQRRCH